VKNFKWWQWILIIIAIGIVFYIVYPNPNKSEQNKPQKHGITEKIFLDS